MIKTSVQYDSELVVRGRLALVMGELRYPRLLGSLRRLFDTCEATAFVLRPLARLGRPPSWAQVKLYEPLDGMPGYMRGLEDDLAAFDALLVCGVHEPCATQALRAARRHGKPFFVYLFEELGAAPPAEEGVLAAEDILAAADGLIVPSLKVYQQLAAAQRSHSNILILPPVVELDEFRPAEERRSRFRSYIKLSADDIVVLFHAPLEKATQPEMLLKALRYLLGMETSPAAERVRLILSGTGEQALNLKYLAYQLGIGQKTYFLHQDPEPFLCDLYAACDFIVFPRFDLPTSGGGFPFGMLEAMGAGVIPLVAAGTLHEAAAGIPELVVHGDHYQNLALCLRRLIDEPSAVAELRRRVVAQVIQNYSYATRGHEVLSFLAAAFARQNTQRTESMEELKAIEDEVRTQGDGLVLGRIERVLQGDLHLEDRSRLLCIQGEVLTGLGRFDEAVTAFENALLQHEENGRSYRGLGYVSWHSYSHEEAMTFFRKALGIDPNDAAAMLGVGLVYKRVGMLDDAIFWLERSVEGWQGESRRPRIALIQACSEYSDPQLGIRILSRLLENLGEDVQLLCALGQLQVRAGQAVEGHKNLRKYLI